MKNFLMYSIFKFYIKRKTVMNFLTTNNFKNTEICTNSTDYTVVDESRTT